MTGPRKVAIFGPKVGVDNRAVRLLVRNLKTGKKEARDGLAYGALTLILQDQKRGVGAWAREEADELNVNYRVILPNKLKYGQGAKSHAVREAVMAAHDVVVFLGDEVDVLTERAVRRAIEWQRPLVVFGPEGQVLRFIEQYAPPEKMATRIKEVPGNSSGPSTPKRKRTERTERRKTEAKKRRFNRTIEGRLEAMGVILR